MIISHVNLSVQFATRDRENKSRASKRQAAAMLLITVFLAIASISSAKRLNHQDQYLKSQNRNDFVAITVATTYDPDYEEPQRINRNYNPIQESMQTTFQFMHPLDNQDILKPRYRHTKSHKRSRNGYYNNGIQNKHYITSDEIRSKERLLAKKSREAFSDNFSNFHDYESENYPRKRPIQRREKNKRVPQRSVQILGQSEQNQDSLSVFGQSNYEDSKKHYDTLILNNEQETSASEMVDSKQDSSYSNENYLQPAEVQQVSPQYFSSANNDFFLPSQIDTSKQYPVIQNEKVSNFTNTESLPTIVNLSTQLLNVNDIPDSLPVEIPKKDNYIYLSPTVSELPNSYLPPSFENIYSPPNDKLYQPNTDVNLQYQNTETVLITEPPPNVSVPSIQFPIQEANNLTSWQQGPEEFQMENFNVESSQYSNETADRRNDYSPQYSAWNQHPITLRPIKQYNLGNPPFQQEMLRNQIDRSSVEQNVQKSELHNTYNSQDTDMYVQSNRKSQYGSKLEQQTSLPTSLLIPNQQLLSNPEPFYEPSTNSKNSYDISESKNNLRQPIELITPQRYDQHSQLQSSYANRYDHHSYSSEVTTEGIPILKQTSEIAFDGSFHYETLTGDQTHVIQEGHIENPGSDNEEQVIHGSYSFVGADGITYTVNYVADANGFRAAGEHLPTPPPIPEVIQKSIDINLAAEANKASSLEYQNIGNNKINSGEEFTRNGLQNNFYDQISRNFNTDSKRPIQVYQSPFIKNSNNHPSTGNNQQSLTNNRGQLNYKTLQNDESQNNGNSHPSIKNENYNIYQGNQISFPENRKYLHNFDIPQSNNTYYLQNYHNIGNNANSQPVNYNNQKYQNLQLGSNTQGVETIQTQNIPTPQLLNNNNGENYSNDKSNLGQGYLTGPSNHNTQGYTKVFSYPSAQNNANSQSYASGQSNANSQSYLSGQSNTDSQSYPSGQSNTDIQSYTRSQSYPSGQSNNIVQGYTTGQSNNHAMGYPTAQSNNLQGHQNSENSQDVDKYKNFQAEKTNIQGPQSSYNQNVQFNRQSNYQPLQLDNVQTYQPALTTSNNKYQTQPVSQVANERSDNLSENTYFDLNDKNHNSFLPSPEVFSDGDQNDFVHKPIDHFNQYPAERSYEKQIQSLTNVNVVTDKSIFTTEEDGLIVINDSKAINHRFSAS